MEIKDAIYSWWVRPLAVADGDQTWVSGVDRRGHNVITCVADGKAERVQLGGATQADDHNAAALWRDPVQPRLLAAGSRHNKDAFVRLWTVDRETLAASSPQLLEMGGGPVSYAQLLHHSNNDVLHLLCRRAQDQWVYRTSLDGGDTWQPAKILFDGDGLGQVYLTTRPDPADPALVHIATVGHPSQAGLPNVGYGRLRLDTGAVTRLDGDLLGNLADPGGPAVAPAELDQAIVPSGNYRVRLLEVGVVDGQPAIAYVVWNTGNPDYLPAYKIKQWTGSAWATSDWSLPAGEIFGHTASAHYHGGVTVADDGGLWTSRHDGTHWVLERWPAGWAAPVEVARSKTRLIRPYAIPQPALFEVVYQDCLYEHYTRYYSDLVVI